MKKPILALLLALAITGAATAWLDASQRVPSAQDVCVLKAVAPATQQEGAHQPLRIARA
ncbi:MAG TPA: hypothetical protein VN782_05870 [Usitatibacter sp.]|nr:hypothetical protein [Usitatibacter sp.]